MSAYGNDCHFYYNSTCTKGESCAFRHCEAAKDCLVTCTFWQQGICSKPNCPFRHVELPPETVQRNRQAIPCYWENQPVGCSRANCQYQHFKPRPFVQSTTSQQDQPMVSEHDLPDTRIPPPMFGQNLQPNMPQTVVPIPGAPVIQPVVVQFSDSEVESDKNSPVKNGSAFKPVTTFTSSQIPVTSSIRTVTPVTTQIAHATEKTKVMNFPDLDYFIGKPYPKTNKSPPRTLSRSSYDSGSDRSFRSRSPSPRGRSISPRRRRSSSPRRSRSPRRRSPYLRDRSRSPRRWSPRRRSPSPRVRMTARNAISRPQDRFLHSRRPVHERLNRDGNFPSTSSSRDAERARPPIAVSPKKISLSKIKDKTDSDDDKIKVKSLEEIQRAKALLSMGLIELKSGKIVKVGEVDKYKEEENTDVKPEVKVQKKKKVVKKDVKVKKSKEKPKQIPKAKKVPKILKKVENKKEESEESSDEIVDARQDEVEEDVDEGDDLGEEPEIHLEEVTNEFDDEGSEEDESEKESESDEEEQSESEYEPESVQYTQDIRRAVRKEDVETKITPPSLKRKRKVIVDEEENKKTAKIKVSVQSRLGRKLDSTEVKVDKHKIPSRKIGVKSRLELKTDRPEEVGSSNIGTIQSGGIKSRLGHVDIVPKETSSIEPITVTSELKKIVLKRTIETKGEEKKEVVKKRRWITGSVKNRLGNSASDSNISDTDLKKIVIVRNINEDSNSSKTEENLSPQKERQSVSQENESKIKSTLSRINKIIEDKKESQEKSSSDPETRKKDRNKLNVWSSRVAESISSVKPVKRVSDIDLYDSSSNDSISMELKPHSKGLKLSKKGPKQERALYVPPARKRTVTSYDDNEDIKVTPPKKSDKKPKEEKSEPESIKTYSQIMEEKRRKLEKQREKKAKTEEKIKKKKINPIVFSDKENENVSPESPVMDEIKPTSPVKIDEPVPKNSLLDSFSFTLPSSSEKTDQLEKVDNSKEHIELLRTLEPDKSTQELDDFLKSPTKTSSDDKWLEFSKEDLDMTGCGPADDDDLLREIDELLA